MASGSAVCMKACYNKQSQPITPNEIGKLHATHLQQIVSARPLLRIDLQCETQKVPENRRQLMLRLNLRRPVRGDQIQRPQRALGEVRRFAFNHLDRHNPQGPNIDFAPVLLPRHNFWSHPVRRADHSRALHLALIDLRAEAEIREFDTPLHAQEDVVGLDIPMDDTLAVQELQPMQRLATDGANLALGHHIKCHDIRQTPALHVLHDDPQVALHQERVHEVDDILVPAVLHDQDLVDDEILLGLLLEVHLFDGNALVRPDFVGGVDATGGALADLHQAAVFLRWVRGVAYVLKLGEDFGVCDRLPGLLSWSRHCADSCCCCWVGCLRWARWLLLRLTIVRLSLGLRSFKRRLLERLLCGHHSLFLLCLILLWGFYR